MFVILNALNRNVVKRNRRVVNIFFRLKTTSWVGFVLSELNLIFYLSAQSLILLESLFKWKFEKAASVTVENKEAPSAKKFELECKFFVKSLMYSRKSSGPRMEPWGTPALMSAHEECWPVKLFSVFCCLENQLKGSINSQ